MLDSLSEDLCEAVFFPVGDQVALRSLVVRFAGILESKLGHIKPNLSGEQLFAPETLLDNPDWACQLAQASPRDTQIIPAPSSFSRQRRMVAWMELLEPEHTEPLDQVLASFGSENELTPTEAGTAFQSAGAILEQAWPEAQREVRYLVRGLRMARSHVNKQSSGSSVLCPFTIAMSFDPNAWPGYLADALVHECAHIKLRMAMECTPFCTIGGPVVYHHPWRPDARPLEGLMLATHAFVAIHRLYVRLVLKYPSANSMSYEKQLRAEVTEALTELRSAHEQMTELGKMLVYRLIEEFDISRSSIRVFGKGA